MCECVEGKERKGRRLKEGTLFIAAIVRCMGGS
jgi:hypothetical protein